MNKFLKGAIACAMVVPCMTGLVGCGKKVDKTEVAYNEVMAEVETIAGKFSAIETVGTEFQLNINMSLDVQQLINGVPSPEDDISVQLKAALGARHSQTNKEIFGDISIVGEQDATTSILNAYIVDSIGENEYTKLGLLTQEQWNALKDNLYLEAEGVYEASNTTFNAEAEYYMITEDLMHVYMNSNISALTSEIGFDITQILPMFNDGKVYGTLYTGDDVLDGEQEDLGIDEIFNFDEMFGEDYNDFKQDLAETGMSLTRVENNGDVGIKISGEGNTIEIIVKANGGLRLSLDMLMPTGETSVANIGVVIDIDVVDEIEESYIPTDLTGYGEALDLEAWLKELMSGN